MKAGAEEANALARLRAFSWSRFLTRLERTLPNDVRVESLSLTDETGAGAEQASVLSEESFRVGLSLVARDPDDLYRVAEEIRLCPGITRTSTSVYLREVIGYRVRPLLRAGLARPRRAGRPAARG